MPIYHDLAPDEIQVSHFNPAKRVERNQLTGLLLSVREHGIVTPLALAHDRVLSDGHRRLAVAKMLKLETVPVAIYTESPLSAPELWVLLNSDTLSLSPAQWLAAVDAGLPIETNGFPQRLKVRIERLYDLVGKEDVGRLVEEGRSPMVIDAAEQVARYCGFKGDDKFLKKVLHWLINTGNAWSIRGAIEDKVPADLLVEAIENNLEVGRVWDIVR